MRAATGITNSGTIRGFVDLTDIAFHANVTTVLIPAVNPDAPNVIVEIRRRYKDMKTPAGDSLAIENYPTNCTIIRH